MVIRNGLIMAYDRASTLLAASMSAFAIYVAAFGVFDNVIVSGLTVLLALLYGFLAWRGPKDRQRRSGSSPCTACSRSWSWPWSPTGPI